jgi:hypothetical protein
MCPALSGALIVGMNSVTRCRRDPAPPWISNCWKKEPVVCGLHRLALWLLPALAFVALIPLTMPLRPFKIVMPVFLSDVVWLKDFWNLFFEFRLYPILGALGFMMSFLYLRRGRSGLIKSQLPFFLALGFTSYSFFRFGLLLTFNENQGWADWWEESRYFYKPESVNSNYNPAKMAEG